MGCMVRLELRKDGVCDHFESMAVWLRVVLTKLKLVNSVIGVL